MLVIDNFSINFPQTISSQEQKLIRTTPSTATLKSSCPENEAEIQNWMRISIVGGKKKDIIKIFLVFFCSYLFQADHFRHGSAWDRYFPPPINRMQLKGVRVGFYHPAAAKYFFNSWFNDQYGFAWKKKRQKEEKCRKFPVYVDPTTINKVFPVHHNQRMSVAVWVDILALIFSISQAAVLDSLFPPHQALSW